MPENPMLAYKGFLILAKNKKKQQKKQSMLILSIMALMPRLIHLKFCPK